MSPVNRASCRGATGLPSQKRWLRSVSLGNPHLTIAPRTSPSCNFYNRDGLQELQKGRLIHEVTGRPHRQPNFIGPCPIRTSGGLVNSCRQEMLHWHTACFELFRNEQSSTRTHGEVIRPEPRFSNYLPARGRRATLRLRPTSTFMPTQAGTLPATSRPLAFFGFPRAS